MRVHSRKGGGRPRLWGWNAHGGMEFNKPISEHRKLWREIVGIKVANSDWGLPRKVFKCLFGKLNYTESRPQPHTYGSGTVTS